MRSDELREILVARRDDDVDAVRRGLQSERADHVVGLDAVDAQLRKAERVDELPHRRDLRDEFVRHRCAMRLVLGVEIIAECPARRVNDERDVVGLRLERRAQHIDHAEQGAGRLAAAVGQRRQRVKRTI